MIRWATVAVLSALLAALSAGTLGCFDGSSSHGVAWTESAAWALEEAADAGELDAALPEVPRLEVVQGDDDLDVPDPPDAGLSPRPEEPWRGPRPRWWRRPLDGNALPGKEGFCVAWVPADRALAISSQDVDSNGILDGELFINGVEVPASGPTDDPVSTVNAHASAIAKAVAINRILAETRVSARVVPTSMKGCSALLGGDLEDRGLIINGVEMGPLAGVLPNDADGRLVARLEERAEESGVHASVAGGRLVLEAPDGRNINVVTWRHAAEVTGITAGADNVVEFGGLRLSSPGRITVTESAAGEALSRLGISVGTYHGMLGLRCARERRPWPWHP